MTGNWNLYNTNFGSNAYNKIQQLSNLTGEATSSNYWGADNTTPSSTLVHVNQANYSSGAGADFIMYAFSSVEGYSKFGSYLGNGNDDGTFVYTGFRVSWLMVKSLSGSHHWLIKDNKRPEHNPATKGLYANENDSEIDTSSRYADLYANGFKPRGTHGQQNTSGQEYFYFAFAESPFKNARAR